MQSAAYAEFLSDVIELICPDANSSERTALDALHAAVAAGGKRQLAKTLESLAAADHESAGVFGNGIGNVVEALRRLARFTDSRAKKSIAGDTMKLLDFVQSHPDFAVDGIASVAERIFTAPAPKPRKQAVAGAPAHLVETYLRRLDETFGFEPDFTDVYAELKADPVMKAAQLKKLAKLFTKMNAKSASDALRLIYQKHHTVASAEQHKRAVGDRVAG